MNAQNTSQVSEQKPQERPVRKIVEGVVAEYDAGMDFGYIHAGEGRPRIAFSKTTHCAVSTNVNRKPIFGEYDDGKTLSSALEGVHVISLVEEGSGAVEKWCRTVDFLEVRRQYRVEHKDDHHDRRDGQSKHRRRKEQRYGYPDQDGRNPHARLRDTRNAQVPQAAISSGNGSAPAEAPKPTAPPRTPPPAPPSAPAEPPAYIRGSYARKQWRRRQDQLAMEAQLFPGDVAPALA